MAEKERGESGTRPTQLSAAEERKRKERVLTQGAPSLTASIADAVVAKNQGLYLLTGPDGIIPLQDGHGYGLYYQDCRYLDGYEMRIAGEAPKALLASANRGYAAIFQLTNPEIRSGTEAQVPREGLGIRWERVLDSDGPTVHERISVENFGTEAVSIPLGLVFRACFEDIYIVREFLDEVPGHLHPPEWTDGALRLVYDGADDRRRTAAIHFSPRPDHAHGTLAEFRVELGPRKSTDILVSIALAETELPEPVRVRERRSPDFDSLREAQERTAESWVGHFPRVRTSCLAVQAAVDRSFRDLHMLRTRIQGEEFFAAGVPWFVTLFGRDAAITALHTLWLDSGISARTLRLLASYQGKEHDDWRDEQPGKILHELRTGELARLGEIPHTPYYGTVDATPLFLVLLGRHAHWTGSLELFDELRDPVELALRWMDEHGDADGDGFIDYERISPGGLANQGWKDSGDAMVNRDGSFCEPPIAPIEAQAYAYRARLLMAGLFERSGEGERASGLRGEARRLRARVQDAYWVDELETYAMALQRGGRPAEVVSSNPGHALWAGLADDDSARRTVRRLMADDMFSGWGIRTLSSAEQGYNPIGYHLGTVWPHDNAIALAGFRRYGFDDEACRIFTGLVEAAMRLRDYRLPELFGGFARGDFDVPVHYPVANHPQAWAAAAIPYALSSLLGLRPDAFAKRLRVQRPVLPAFIGELEVSGLRVGEGEADLVFQRSDRGVRVQIVRVEGELEVEVMEAGGSQEEDS